MLGVHNLINDGMLAPDKKLRARWNRLRPNWLTCSGAALVLVLLAAIANAAPPHAEPTVEELKAKVASANVAEKAKLCVQIAEKELSEANKQYADDDLEKARATLSDVVTFSELARDYSIQSHKHEKQIEISVRTMTRKLGDLMHSLSHGEQEPVKNAMQRLERVRDDLLTAMFPKGLK